MAKLYTVIFQTICVWKIKKLITNLNLNIFISLDKNGNRHFKGAIQQPAGGK